MSAAAAYATARSATSAPQPHEPKLARWGTLLRSAAAGSLDSNKPFPPGSFTDIEGTETSSSVYHFTLTWTPRNVNPYRTVEISVYAQPDAGRVYNRVEAESLTPKNWSMMGPDGWIEWPRGYPSGKGLDSDVEMCGRTHLGLKVAWLQRGQNGKRVAVILESLAGDRCLRDYADGVARAVRKALE